MMNIILKIVQWIDVWKNGLDDMFVIGQNFFQRIGRKMIPCLKIEEFSE